jgi:hypothetical protein
MGERDIEWLSKQDAFEVGVKAERERIIALLGAELERMRRDSPSGEAYHNASGVETSIQLIEDNYVNTWAEGYWDD